MKSIHITATLLLSLFFISCSESSSEIITDDDSISLKISVMEFNYCDNIWQDSSSNIIIMGDGIELISQELSVSQNSLLIPLDYSQYEITTTKAGFQSETNVYMKKELMEYTESPLVLELNAKTYIGDVILETMEDYFDFVAEKYGRIDGNLSLFEIEELNSLEDLESLTSIEGGLRIIKMNSLTSLKGLEQISSLGGDLSVYDNMLLTNIEGLKKVGCIGRSIWVQENPELNSLNGLENVTEISGKFDVNQNTKLSSLDGLANIEYIGEEIYIKSNPLITNLMVFSKLETINSDLEIQYNIGLTDMTGLNNITKVLGSLRISENRITSLNGLEKLVSIDGNLDVYNNSYLYGWCALQSLFIADGLSGGHLFGNCSYNPTIEDIKNGNCQP